ncbi:MAG: type IV pilin protein [Pseudomonadota bacterium]
MHFDAQTTQRARLLGFTLIELMITVAIVAILAAIAYPSYRDSVDRSRRGDAKAVLLENAQWLERQYTVSSAYNKLGHSGGAAITSASLPVREAPKDSSTKTYDISFKAGEPTASSFVLYAVPKGPMAADKCGTLSLSQTGARDVVNAASGVSAADCWGR